MSPPCVSLFSECHEHDARDQHPVLADEGEPTVLDSEGLPVQRCVLSVASVSPPSQAPLLILYAWRYTS